MTGDLDLVSRQWPALAACVAGLVVALRCWQVLPRARARRPLREFGRGEESATAMLDFILTFPLFTMIILVVIQFALMVNARIVVSYAAYTAARSAIVHSDGGLEAAKERAEAAAAIGCLPISPPLTAGLSFPNPPLALLMIHGGETPDLPGSEFLRRWQRAGGKHLYSQLATEVELTGATGGDEVEARAPLTATVTHQFHLAVPYADGVFAGLMGKVVLGRNVVPIRDSVTFLNEGKVETVGKNPKDKCKFFF